MPRKKLIRSPELPYHLTARTNNRETFPGEMAYAWRTLTGELYLQQILHGLRIHALVLMPNHFHLLATSGERGIDLAMKEVLGSTTRILNTRTRRSGHLFGGRYFWSLIREPDYYAHALKYVLRNPVKAALSTTVSDYPLSTYSGQVGEVPLPVAITSPTRQILRLVPEDPEALDAWLNSAHPTELQEAIQKGLRRKEFTFAPQEDTRRKPQFTI
jgi:putative transposase